MTLDFPSLFIGIFLGVAGFLLLLFLFEPQDTEE
jgi:hypothetical protein